jgi:hypothetical protein
MTYQKSHRVFLPEVRSNYMAMYGLYRELDKYPASERDSRLADILHRIEEEQGRISRLNRTKQ